MSFLDLIEVRFVDAFLEVGVTWPTIRAAFAKARELMQADHPFASRRFHTDGRSILAEIARKHDDTALLNLIKNQFEMSELVFPFLVRGIEFTEEEIAMRWWPLGENRDVVLDPERRFGKPVVNSAGIPTATLDHAFRAEQSYERVAALYEIGKNSVIDAVEFENLLVA